MTDVNIEALTRRFEEMGARVKIEKEIPFRANPRRTLRFFGAPQREAPSRFTVDLRKDNKGQFFFLRYDQSADIRIQVVDTQPDDRHLLLFIQNGTEKGKYLCGHDEREWFTCAVPNPSVHSIETAKQALKPEEVVAVEEEVGIKGKDKNKRINKGWKRQGEWFFIPMKNQEQFEEQVIHHDEPLRRGRGRPHVAEECIRIGGQTVYVCREFPNGVSQEEFSRLNSLDQRKNRNRVWQAMTRDAKVYVRGSIKQPGGHKTLVLKDWHRVLPNTESKAPWAERVAFLD